MTEFREIRPTGPLRGTVRPPGSKSITNRALVCATLASGSSVLHGVLESEDTQVMVDALQALGIGLEWDRHARSIRVAGSGGRVPAPVADLYIANSGTTVRFLTALLALGTGTYRLHGTPRMHERPIQDLLDALAQLGVDARSEHGTGCPPVTIAARGFEGGRVSVRGNVSSQFLSAILQVAPYARRGLGLTVDGPLVSQPYVAMTLAVMRAFGVESHASDDLSQIVVPPGAYQGTNYHIEPDASAASYFFAAAAITGGEVSVQGLTRQSLQGDVGLVDLLARMGCEIREAPEELTIRGGPLVGIECDMNSISDTVQTLAVVALFAEGPTTIRGVEHIRYKETDRISALVCELRRVGAAVDEFQDGLRITPAALHGARIETYHDHRMAMSMALVGLREQGIVILDPGCTAKTYPGFFDDLAHLAAQSASAG